LRKVKKIAQETLRILRDPKTVQRITSDLALVKSSLGSTGAANRAAEIILNTLKE
jgi:lipid A disaccharide synthetase